MICTYGMSDRIGPVSLGDDDHDVFLGRDFVSRKDYSEKKAQEVDDEVTRILRSLYEEAKQLLADQRPLLDRISEALLERETLDGAELELLRQGRALPPLPAPAAGKPPVTPRRGAAAPQKAFPGDKLPDPEPVPG
jgi:cell division protease FtsH